jgi:hypothetical protein
MKKPIPERPGFLRIRIIDFLIMLIALLAVYLFCSTFYFQKGIESAYKICPSAQENEMLLKSVQYQDGLTVCAYADLQGWAVKRHQNASK